MHTYLKRFLPLHSIFYLAFRWEKTKQRVEWRMFKAQGQCRKSQRGVKKQKLSTTKSSQTKSRTQLSSNELLKGWFIYLYSLSFFVDWTMIIYFKPLQGALNSNMFEPLRDSSLRKYSQESFSIPTMVQTNQTFADLPTNIFSSAKTPGIKSLSLDPSLWKTIHFNIMLLCRCFSVCKTSSSWTKETWRRTFWSHEDKWTSKISIYNLINRREKNPLITLKIDNNCLFLSNWQIDVWKMFGESILLVLNFQMFSLLGNCKSWNISERISLLIGKIVILSKEFFQPWLKLSQHYLLHHPPHQSQQKTLLLSPLT